MPASISFSIFFAISGFCKCLQQQQMQQLQPQAETAAKQVAHKQRRSASLTSSG